MASQKIPEDDEYIQATLATLTDGEALAFVQALFHSADVNRAVLLSHLNTLIMQRQQGEVGQEGDEPEEGKAQEAAAGPAAAALLTPEQVRSVQADAVAQADAREVQALESISVAQGVVGEYLAHWLEQARARLQEGDAAAAEQLIHDVLTECRKGARKAVKDTGSHVRDVIVFQARARCDNPLHREQFLQMVAGMYKEVGELGKLVRAQILLSYQKQKFAPSLSFPSNAQLRADERVRNGLPGPRRKRHRKKNVSDTSSNDHEEGASSSGCAAASEPMYVVPWHTMAWQDSEDTPGAASSACGAAVHPSSSMQPQTRVHVEDLNMVGPRGLLPELDVPVIPGQHHQPGHTFPPLLAPQAPYNDYYDQAFQGYQAYYLQCPEHWGYNASVAAQPAQINTAYAASSSSTDAHAAQAARAKSGARPSR
jgi:hypothetical protein